MEHYFTNNQNLKSEIREIYYENNGEVFKFFSDLGVFSKDKVDFGSKVLLETVLEMEKRKNLNILDVGCGYGFLGIVLSRFLESHVDMVDINLRAIHLCTRNIKENKVNAHAFASNIYKSVNSMYDIIISNPPIRAGKKVVMDILLGAQKHLNQNGILWFVIRKDQGAKSILKSLENIYDCKVVKKEKGFYIMFAKIH